VRKGEEDRTDSRRCPMTGYFVPSDLSTTVFYYITTNGLMDIARNIHVVNRKCCEIFVVKSHMKLPIWRRQKNIITIYFRKTYCKDANRIELARDM